MTFDLSDCAAVVTAAGLSSRMKSPKALLDWKGKPLILHQIETLRGFGQLLVVTGHEASRLRPYLPPFLEVFNPDYLSGRTSSLLAAFEKLSPCRAVLVCAVDQPLETGLPEALVEAIGQHPYAYPVHEGRRGHPLLFNGKLLPELRKISDEEEGLKKVSRRHAEEAIAVPWNSPLIFADLNHPSDPERWR